LALTGAAWPLVASAVLLLLLLAALALEEDEEAGGGTKTYGCCWGGCEAAAALGSPSSASQALSSAHVGAGTAVTVGPNAAAVL